MIFGRRELLKAIVPASMAPTFVINGISKSEAHAIRPGHYLLFVDRQAIDLEALCNSPHDLPEGTVIHVIPVYLHGDQSIDDAVRIYELAHPRDRETLSGT